RRCSPVARQRRQRQRAAEAAPTVSQRAAGSRRRLDSLARRYAAAARGAGDTPMVQLLLERGALVDLPSNQGVTPLMAAAGVEFGLRVTRGRNRTDEGVLSTMRALLDAGADINARMLIEPRGESAAHLLVIEQRLSDYSYDYRGRQVPSVRAKPHRTALHGAAMKGFTSIVKFLAE